jgi:hypothetical protein
MQRAKFKELRTTFGGKSVAELIDLLSSGDLQTRFFAEMALRDATAT